MKARAADIAGIIRLPFLLLTPLCIGVGSVIAWHRTGSIDLFNLALALTGGLAAHIAVNALNEYHDFKSGLDLHTHRTPFSGGSGTLPSRPELAGLALKIGAGALLLTALIGVYFVFAKGPGILLTGIPGLILVVAYTPHILRHPLLTLFASGFGFGPVMVLGGEYALTGSYSLEGLCAALVIFFLVNNLLLINQIPDVDVDRKFGRRTVPILLGPHGTLVLIGLFFLLAYASLALGVLTMTLPVAAMVGFLTVPLAAVVFWRMAHSRNDVRHLVPAMGLNVVLVLLTPALLMGGYLVMGLTGGS